LEVIQHVPDVLEYLHPADDEQTVGWLT